DHFRGFRLPDQPCQSLRAGKSGNQPEIDLRLAEARGGRRNPERTGHCQLAPAAKRKAIDGSNDRFAELLNAIEDTLTGTCTLARRLRRIGGKLGDVGARDKCFITCTGDDHAADRGGILEIEKRAAELVEGPGIERVEALRSIDGENGKTV